MIRLPLPWLVFMALFIFLTGIMVAWIGYAIVRNRAEKRKLLAWTKCPVCSFRHKIQPSPSPTRCPQCGSLNEHHPLQVI
jgi:hypothetical protein